MTEEEQDRAYERDDMFIIVPFSPDSEDPSGNRDVITSFHRAKKQNYSSKDAPPISKDRLKEFLKNF